MARGRDLWRKRCRDINDWERYLTDNGFTIVKLLLNLSEEEQRTRYLQRIDLPDHNWMLPAADVRERSYRNDYQKAFLEMLSSTSAGWAPWYIIPADHKWFARICASAVIANALIEIDPRYLKVTPEVHEELQRVKVQLEGEAPEGAAHDPFGAEALEEAVKAEGETGNKTRKKAGKEAEKAKRETAGDGRREAMAMTDTAPTGNEGGAA